MNISTIPPALAEAIGMVGFGLYVLNYIMLTLHVLCSRSVAYFAINLAAAVSVLIGLSASFNLPAALIQTFFITISLVGIALRLKIRRADRAGTDYSPAAVRRTVSSRDAFGG